MSIIIMIVIMTFISVITSNVMCIVRCVCLLLLLRLSIIVLTPNLPTNNVDVPGFDSSIISILRGGIPRSIGDFPESLSQAMLIGTTLVGGLGVFCCYVLVDILLFVLSCTILGYIILHYMISYV